MMAASGKGKVVFIILLMWQFIIASSTTARFGNSSGSIYITKE